MGKHFIKDIDETDEEATTLDGKSKYWRTAVPLPMEKWGKYKYECVCGRKFREKEHYELHYRMAYMEEKMIETTKSNRAKEK